MPLGQQPFEQQVVQRAARRAGNRGPSVIVVLARAMQHRRVAAPEIDDKIVGEIVLDDAPNIVLAKDLAIH